MKHIILVFFLLLNISALFSQSKFSVNGSADIKGEGSEANFNARNNAILKAYQSAISKAILKIIPETVFKNNEKAIKDQIFNFAKSFIKEEEIIDEDIKDKKYVVSLDVVIDDKKLSESLKSLSINTDIGSLSDMNMAVAVDEIIMENNNIVEVRTGSKSLIGTKISSELLSKGIQLKSEDIIEQIREKIAGPGGNLSSFLTGKNDDEKSQLAAKMISGDFNIDAIIFGTTKINYGGKDKDGFDIATASANIRIIEVSSGRILAAAVSNETGIAKTKNEAYAAASRRLGSVLSQKLAAELQTKWLSILNDGVDYEINFRGQYLNDKVKNDLIKTLNNIKGVVSIREQAWNSNKKDLTVNLKFKGKPSLLKDEIFKNCLSVNSLSGIHEEITTGNKIGYYIDKPVKTREVGEGTPLPITGFQKPNIYAVIIGVSEYSDKSMNLNAAANDAKMIQDYIVSKEGLNVKPENVKLILNKEATKSEILKSIKDKFSKTNENDLIILYFAGHGWAEEKEMYFLSYDTKKNSISTTAISQKDLQKVLETVPARRQIFIADACHSGALSLAYMTYASSSGSSDTRSVDGRVSLIKNIIGSSTGLSVITAASANQQAQEGPRWENHGAFTYYLIKGLKGEADENSDHIITVDEVHFYTLRNVRTETQGKQSPTVSGPTDIPLGVVK